MVSSQKSHTNQIQNYAQSFTEMIVIVLWMCCSWSPQVPFPLSWATSPVFMFLYTSLPLNLDWSCCSPLASITQQKWCCVIFQDYIRIFAYHPEFLGMRALVILCFGTPVAYCEKLQPHAKVTCFPVVTSLTLAPSWQQHQLPAMWVSHLGCPTQMSLQVSQPQQLPSHSCSTVPKWKLPFEPREPVQPWDISFVLSHLGGGGQFVTYQ